MSVKLAIDRFIDKMYLIAGNLQINLELLKQLKPTDINHFIPLLLLEPSKLQTFEWMCPKDDTDADQKHFIYYFSDKTQVKPTPIARWKSL